MHTRPSTARGPAAPARVAPAAPLPPAGRVATRLRSLGQGTVEYIGMVVMVTLLVAAVAAAAKGWAPDIGSALKRALTTAVRKLSGAMDG